MPARVSNEAQVEHALAIDMLVGGTESVSVDVPGGVVSTNFSTCVLRCLGSLVHRVAR